MIDPGDTREIIDEFQAAIRQLKHLLDVLGHEVESWAMWPSDELDLHERMAQCALQLERASRDVRRGLALIAIAVPDPEVLGAAPVVPRRVELVGDG